METTMPKPKVVISRMALEKIRYFVNKDDKECSGMGMTRVDGDTIYVDDVMMLKQKNGAVHTDIDPDAVNALAFKMKDSPGELNFWWHSHVNMSVFWSGQDKDTIKQLAQHGMCVAAVFNKKHEIRTAVAAKVELPFSKSPEIIMWDELQMLVLPNIPDELKAAWDKEHEESVVKYVPPTQDHTRTGLTGREGGSYSSHGRLTSRFGFEPDANEFFPIETQDKNHWDNYSQMTRYDVNPPGARWDNSKQKYFKSALHLQAEKTWELEHGVKIKETVPDSDESDKIRFAMGREDVVGYDKVLDMFEMANGSKIDASWFMTAAKRYSLEFSGRREKTAQQEQMERDGEIVELDFTKGGVQ